MRKLFSPFLIILLETLITGGLPAFSQNYPFRQYSVSDGLPQSQSSAIYQDSRGFLWISTRNGLSRFDGIEFINYSRKDGLGSNFINQIFEDTNGYVYALSQKGLSKYDGSRFIFYNPPDSLNVYGLISAAYFNNGNSILLLYDDLVYGKHGLFSFENGTYKDYSANFPALDSIYIKDFSVDVKNNILIILNKNGTVYSWHNNKLSRISDQKYTRILKDNDNVILFKNDSEYIFSESKMSELHTIKDTWIGATTFTGKQETMSSFVLHKGGREYLVNLPFGTYTEYLVDNENNVWIASERNLYRLVSTAFSTLDIPNDIIQNIWAIAEDKNSNLWLGSLYGNLIEFDGKQYRLRNNYKSLFPGETGFFKGSRKISDGDIYFSTNQGVLTYNGKSFSRINGIIDFSQVCYIYEDTVDKSVFIGTNRGLFQILKDTIINYPEFVDSYFGVVEGMVRESKNRYWISGHKGLVQFENFVPEVVIDSILPQADTYTIDIDRSGGLWVTSEGGLYFKPGNSENFVHGLPEKINTPANSLCMMDSSHLIVGRTTDICIIDIDKFYLKKPDYFRIYDKSDGFSGNDCLDNGIIKDSKGRLLILTSGGVDVLDKESLVKNNFPPRLYITTVEAATDSLTWIKINDPSLFYNQHSELILNRKQNNLRISYSGISTSNPEKVTYQYRLLGYEENWSARVSGRKAVYEKLPPGNYSFQVKAYNADGILTEQPNALNIRIVPAFWQTLLFKVSLYMLVISLTILSTLGIMRYKQKINTERDRMQSELSQLHMGSVLKQFDPHFTFNVLSSVGSLIIKGEKEVAYDYLIKLSSLLRSVVSDGSTIIKPLSGELDFVAKYCEVQKLRFKDRFDWSLNVNENVNLQFEIPKLTIQIFVENAIKHGIEPKLEGGRVDININNTNSGLEIKIVDNGIGRSASGKRNSSGTGYGIKIMSGIFEYMNIENKKKAILELTDLFDSENKSCGTEVKIYIPEAYYFRFDKQNKLLSV